MQDLTAQTGNLSVSVALVMLLLRFRLMANWTWRVRRVESSRATKFRTTKINSGGRVLLVTNLCTPENYPLYGTCVMHKGEGSVV